MLRAHIGFKNGKELEFDCENIKVHKNIYETQIIRVDIYGAKVEMHASATEIAYVFWENKGDDDVYED